MVLRKTSKVIFAFILLILFLLTANNLISNIKKIDRDGDGLTDAKERLINTNSLNIDTDNDGLNDYDEYEYWIKRSKEELSKDFVDFWKEYWENNTSQKLTVEKIRSLLLPTGDIDNDNLSNICDKDSDNDKILDYLEILNNTDPAYPEDESTAHNNSDNSEDTGGGKNKSNEEELSSTETNILIISSTKIYKTGSFYVTGNVLDENKSAVTNTTVEVFVNKTKDTNGSFAGKGEVDINGTFNITCNVPKDIEPGENHVVAHSLGNDEFGDSWSDPIVKIHSDTALSLDILDSVGKNFSFEIKGKLVDSSNLPLKNKKIILKVDEIEIGETDTNKNGKFLFNHTINELGEYDIKAIFEGDEYLNSSIDNKKVDIKDMGTYLDVVFSNNILKREDEITLTGGLFNSKNQPLATSDINFYYNQTKITSQTTDSNGLFEKTITIPIESTLGKNSIKLLYEGSKIYGSAEWIEEIFVQSDTIFNIDTLEGKEFDKNETIIISGLLTDNYNTPIKNNVVNIYSDISKNFTKTDANGSFNFQIKVPNNISYGEYKFILYYNGTDIYLPSQKIFTISLTSKNIQENNNILIIIIAFVLLGIGGVILGLIKKQDSGNDNPSLKKITTDNIENLQNENDFRQAVLKCYQDMCKYLDVSGLKKDTGETPREFAIDIKENLDVSDECLISLTKIFEKACYSEHHIEMQDRDKTIACLNEILSSLKNKPQNQNKK